MISSKKRLTRPSPTPFSSKLAQACIQVSILKLRYSELKRNKDYSLPRILIRRTRVGRFNTGDCAETTQ